MKEKNLVLELYFRDINNTNLLSRQEEMELAQKVKMGDEEALNKLIEANLRFVVNIAKKYANQGISLMDLINEGNMGLIKAAKRFDATKGFKFISYAVWWIRQSITQLLGEQSRIVRLPSNRAGALFKIGRAKDELNQELNREPTLDEIAQRSGVRIKDINIVYQSSSSVSLDETIDEEKKNSLGDLMADPKVEDPDDILTKKDLANDIRKVLKTLDEREATILSLYFGIDQTKSYTLDEIGKILNISRERVRQIKVKALQRLKHTSRKKILISYIE